MKLFVSIVTLSLLTVSCNTQLPDRFYQRSLKEDAYIENYKNKYIIYLPDNDNTNDNIIVQKNAKVRPFYTVIVDSDTLVVSNRQIYFKKADNFRDIGGIKTKDGTTVKWGMVYRSDNLSKLRKREFKKFNSLNIQTVYDLRTPGEIDGKEDNLPENAKYIHAPIVKDTADVLKQIRGKTIKGEITEAQSLQFMTDLYRSIVTDNSEELRQMIQNVTQSDAPVLYHCSAGKDRTGIVTALLLSILNVDRETIINEYLLSDYYRREKLEKILKMAKAAKVVRPKIDIGAIQNFMDVDERYINEAFNVIDTKYGGIDNYIRNQLKITNVERKAIIKKFTY